MRAEVIVMKDAQKPDHISLTSLISRLKDGRFRIPDFQREFEWGAGDIQELMRSIFLDYYIGSLLLWKGKEKNFEALSCEPLYGYPCTGKPEYIVLDGQQRLTAMYYAFFAPDAPLPRRSSRYFFFVHVDKFMAEEYDEAFDYEWLTKHWYKIFDSRDAQYENHIFPLSILGAGGWDLANWVQGYEQFWKGWAKQAEQEGKDTEEFAEHAKNAKEFGEHLKGITDQYQVSYIELDQDLEVDKVCDIFTQINSRGIRLDVFDLVNALLKPKGLQLKQMWRDACTRLEFVETDKMNVYILQVMSILRQTYCSSKYLYYLLPGQEKQLRDTDGKRRKEVLIQNTKEFEELWNKSVGALEAAIKLLRHPQEYGVISSNYLPYVSILPAFAAIQAHVKTVAPNRQLEAQRKIRHWYWASVFNNRYSGAVESTSSRDFVDIKNWIEDDLAEPAFVREFANRFRNIDLRKETKRGTSVYSGIFNLFVLQGARDWMSGNVPQHGDLDDHHIVPKSWGKKMGLQGIDSILNRTPLTSNTNRNVIGDNLPNAYLPGLIQANGERTVRAILESHLISAAALSILLRTPFTQDDFESFIAERQRTIQEAIENLLIKDRLDLSPQLRELDADIEQTELSIRRAVRTVLDGDDSKVPSHVIEKVRERVSKALKKNAALDADFYNTLEGKLEFFDLRELQDTITNKILWTSFEPIFANKEALAAKFGQLAELRNGIRHSRTVDEVTCKEGEAAILWFRQIFTKPSSSTLVAP